MNSRIQKRKLREAAEKFREAAEEFRVAAKTHRFSLNRHGGQATLSKAPRLFLGYCALVRALKSFPEFLTSQSSVVLVLIPKTWMLADLEYLAEVCFEGSSKKPNYINWFSHPTSRNKKGQWDFSPQVQLAYPKVVLFARQGAELHPEVEAAADAVLNLSPATDRDLAALARLLATDTASTEDNDFLRQQPSTFIDAVFRRGRSPTPAINRLKRLIVKTAASSKVLPIEAFDHAGDWVKHLRDDLTAWQEGRLRWQDLDKGVLVYGAPGTGKTSFAISAAHHLGVPIIAGSLAQWQSAGHLGDLLRTMYADFNEARSAAPSVLLIDELDAVGDRRKFSGDNAQYCTEVVNALLEALDGTIGREGVIVIGASNFPERIDPALLRPGRLEKHFELSRPTPTARAQIMGFYLPEADVDLVAMAARRLRGATGADIEHFSRRVRQRARQQGRAVTPADLLSELPPEASPDERDIWRVCIHEAGHAVLTKLFNLGDIEFVEIAIGHHFRGSGLDEAYGRVVVTAAHLQIETETAMCDEIAMSLGGMAAEELFLGDRSTLSGGTNRSDLATATARAIKIVGQFAMGRSLHVLPVDLIDAADAGIFEKFPPLLREVNALLRREYKRAKVALQLHQDSILALATALQREGRLSGDRLEELLSSVTVPTSRAAGGLLRREVQAALQ
ncbi:ATP-dependent Zn protease [Pseudorhizobium halotolerans]|uniref:ATP-dependent Zn protease n=1 Tax=Pseudorhizobium halotolerans TaxID=1233081 RepID=A0ABM8PZ62_9HYPH|nr:AAA family ATPase [Pseudorhizobium halotolerans]CAD7055889.1 ATP-dependent Zn protease [Pseudorhizobium halotolerans]